MSLKRSILPSLLALALAAPMLAAQAADNPDAARLNQRLTALDADSQLNGFGAYERLQARQAVTTLAEAPGRERASALYVAERRVQIAEISARNGAMQREVDRLDRERSELLVEASRQDAARARAEAEHLRLQAQMQAEEAERQRQLQLEADAAKQQDVDAALSTVAGAQTARLNAAREREAKLARQEAELVTGGKLPASKRDGRGEVFALPKDSFASGKAALSGGASATAQTVGAYAEALSAGTVKVEVTGSDAKLAQRRADAIRDAMTAGGIARAKIQATGRSGKGDKAEVVLVGK